MDLSLALLAGGLMSAAFTVDAGPGFVLGGEARWSVDDPDVGYVLGAELRTLLPTRAGTRADGGLLDISLVDAAVMPCFQYKWARVCVVIDSGVAIGGGPPPLAFPDDVLLGMLGFGPRLAVDLQVVAGLGVRAFADLRFTLLDYNSGYSNGGLYTWRNPANFSLFGLAVTYKLPWDGKAR